MANPGHKQTPAACDLRTVLNEKIREMFAAVTQADDLLFELMESLPPNSEVKLTLIKASSALEDARSVGYEMRDATRSACDAGLLPHPPQKPTRDASTDMELTPAHWDSLAARTPPNPTVTGHRGGHSHGV